MYLNRTNIAFSFHKCSVISIVEKQPELNEEEITNVNAFQKQCVINDISKLFMRKMEHLLKSTDYLVIDFLEERFGVVECDYSDKRVLLTNSDALKTSKISALSVLRQIPLACDEYERMFTASLTVFIDRISSYIPMSRIILNEAYLSEYYGNCRQKYTFENIEEIKTINSGLKRLYDIFKEQYVEIKTINYNENENYCMLNHPYGIDCTNHSYSFYANCAGQIYSILSRNMR